MTITGKCAHCGAQVVFGDNVNVIKCDYCDSINVVQDCVHAPTSQLGQSAPTQTQSSAVLREITPDLKFPASLYKSHGNTQGGHLWINKEDLFFKPHRLNFGSLDQLYIHIPDIIYYSIDGSLPIFTKDITFYTSTYSLRITVYSAPKILNVVEERRKLFYQERGLPTPELCKNAEELNNIIGNTPQLEGDSESSYKHIGDASYEKTPWYWSIPGIVLLCLYLWAKCS